METDMETAAEPPEIKVFYKGKEYPARIESKEHDRDRLKLAIISFEVPDLPVPTIAAPGAIASLPIKSAVYGTCFDGTGSSRHMIAAPKLKQGDYQGIRDFFYMEKEHGFDYKHEYDEMGAGIFVLQGTKLVLWGFNGFVSDGQMSPGTPLAGRVESLMDRALLGR
jgi:hypothetical protein